MNTQHQIYRRPTPREAQEYQRGTYLRFALLFIVIVASMVWNLVFAQTAWTFCASENTTCTFTGTKLVRYGEPWGNAPIGNWSPTRTGQYISKYLKNLVLCTKHNFYAIL
jgi:hypothetical protein